MGRIIAIGDVHGCAEEFAELLQAIDPQKDDRIIQLGDLVNRGPDSRGVIELAREYKVEAILGNHELRILRALKKQTPSMLRDYDLETLKQLHQKDWRFLEQLPGYIHLKQSNTVCVHGGFLPDQPWHKQSIDIITSIQVIDQDGQPAKHADAPKATAWAKSWHGDPFVVYGHTPRPNVFERPGSIGIDTGCVYGGHLTPYSLGEGELYQVRARKAYAHSKRLPDPV